VEAVKQGTPASRKVREKERILQVNSTPVKGMSARDVKELIIMSPVKVRLELDRGAQGEECERSETIWRGRLGALKQLSNEWTTTKTGSPVRRRDDDAAHSQVTSALSSFR